MTTLMLLSALIWTTPVPAAEGVAPFAIPHGSLELRLMFRADSRGFVYLADVARPVHDPQNVWPQVRDTVLCEGSQPGVTWGLVLHRLHGAGLALDHVRLVGPAVCILNIRTREERP